MRTDGVMIDDDVEPDFGVKVDVPGAGLGIYTGQLLSSQLTKSGQIASPETEVVEESQVLGPPHGAGVPHRTGNTMELVGKFPQCSGSGDGIRIRCVLDNDEHAARTVENRRKPCQPNLGGESLAHQALPQSEEWNEIC